MPLMPFGKKDDRMTYRGRVEHGVVVLNNPQALPEGTEVEVSPLSAQPARPIGEALEKLAGKAQALPSDLTERRDQYRRERDT
jgi:hypothetical protein